ncbi:MAG TPA: amino acid adenylation domain-containing protein, partial [Longimicrobium sp.]|nr:amino acid adenylation domain-containing protein [Longimicrobium sp.]
TLALRTDLSGDPTLRQLLRRVRQTTLDAYAHQDLPFEKLVEELAPERALGRTPLFQVLFSLQNAGKLQLELPGVVAEPLAGGGAHTKFDLQLFAEERPQGLVLVIQYATDLFLPRTAQRMLGHLQALLHAFAADADQRAWRVPLLAAEERALLAEWNRTDAGAPRWTVVQRFEHWAARTPDAPAVVCEARALTYAEANAAANRLAHHLRSLGVGPDSRVGICLERGVDAIVTLLGVMKAGAAYVAADPAWPAERIAGTLADAGVSVLLTTRDLADAAGDHPARLVLLDEDASAISAHPETPPIPCSLFPVPSQLAYVIYTSGSTGRPKGVMIEHRQLASYVDGVLARLELPEGASYATVSTLAADLGHTSVFPALCTGGALHVVTHERGADAEAFAELMRRAPVDVLKITPSHLAALLSAHDPAAVLPRRRLVLGGEASRAEWIDSIRAIAPELRILNHYGPTETTVGVLTHPVNPVTPSLHHSITPSPSGTLPLGRPLAGSRVYVLDAYGAEQPVGAPGELFIGGVGVGRGYLARPGMTAERFVPDPFAPEAGARMYRTGDRARRLADGAIEFLGRVDDQVKIRGFRVEPGEVEAALLACDGVRRATVVARPDPSGGRRLVAYVVGEEMAPPAVLRDALRRTLPDYMVPSFIVPMEALPLTPNGKVDRRALPEPEPAADAEAYVAPRTPAEEVMAGIWAEVLRAERVGAEDDFFALGGHSLLATRVASRIREVFHCELPLRALFEHSRLAALAAEVERLREGGGAAAAAPILPRAARGHRAEHDASMPHQEAAMTPDAGKLIGGESSAPAAWAPDAATAPLLADEERARIAGWQSGPALPAELVPFPALFAATAAAMPAGIAIEHAGERVTYAELDVRSNRLAHHLRRLGIGPEARVGVCLPRTPELVVALLGVLKTGAAYVTLEPHFPAERIARVLADAEAALLIAHGPTASADLPCPALLLDHPEMRETIAGEVDSALSIEIDPDTLAHVIYTSGSTGTPKGVMIRHGGVAAFLAWMRARFPLAPGERVLGSTSVSFDVHVAEVHFTLAGGGTLVLVRDALALAELPSDAGIVQASMVPTAAQELLALGAMPPSLRRLNLGGEPVPADLVRGLADAGVAEINNYWGPTEDTTYSTEAVLLAGEPVTIGRPLAGRRAYVLDAELRQVPAGVAGDVYVAGCGVSRGYLARPDMTAERYLPDPFGAPGERMYATGDRARWLASGELEYLGRADHQVKVRGFRIEPGEVEGVLRAHPAVLNAAVGVRGEGAARRLVAWVVPAEGAAPSSADLAAFVRERLPEYMVPGAFAVLDAFPLTTSGKIDRLALPEPDWSEGAETYVAPRTPVEEALAAIWAEVLGIERVGARDDFFALGGHSLLATRVLSRIRDLFHCELPLRAIFEHPTLAALSARVERVRAAGPSAEETHAAPHQPVPGSYVAAASFAQERLWFLHQLEPESPAYNISAAWRLAGPLDEGALGAAVDALVLRHEALRTTFDLADGAPVQVIAPSAGARLEVTALDGLPAGERVGAARRVAEEEADRPFDLARGPLFRPRLLRLAADDHVLVITLHHIVGDGWSMRVLYQELGVLYAASLRGEPAPLPELPIQYVDYAAWEREELQGQALEAELAWWRDHLAGAPPLLELPTDHPRPAARSYRGAQSPVVLPAELVDTLRSVANGEGATLFMGLLAAWTALLARWSGQEDVVMGTAVAGRDQAETEGLIGFFANILALRTNLSGDPTYRELLGRVRAEALAALAHAQAPFERVVEELRPDRTLSYSPVVQVVFSLGVPAAGPALEGVRASRLEVDRWTAKFDLAVELAEHPDGSIHGGVQYSTQLFEASTIERLLRHFRALLQTVAGDPDARPGAVELASDEEREALEAWEAGAVDALALPAEAEEAWEADEEDEYADEALPLSFAQQRLWFLEQLEPGGSAYNVPVALRLRGALDVPALERAVEEIVRRHEVLRTTFAQAGGEPVQVIAPAGPLPLPVEPVADEDEMLRRAREEARRPFDLARGPLFRPLLFRLAGDDHLLLLNLHHAVSDGWSMAVLYGELSALYGAFRQGLPSPLPELPIQYADYALWQREHLAAGEMDRQLAWWKERLAGAPAVLELPLDRPRAVGQDDAGASEHLALPPEVSEALAALARREGATMFMVLLAAWQTLLARCSGQDDVVVGSPIAGRTRTETERLIGFFVNTLALRTDLSGDPPFRRLLHAVRETTLEAYAHQDLPFERLVEEVAPERSLTHSPVFQAFFVLQNVEEGALSMPGVQAERMPLSAAAAKHDLTLAAVEGGDGLQLALFYRTALFDASTIRRLLGQLRVLLQAAAANPDARVSALPLLTDEDRALVERWQQGDPLPASLPGFPAHFAVAVARTPHTVALEHGGERITYAELDARSGRIANHLRALGIGPESRVGVCLPRTPELIATLVGVLRTGAAYVPLEPHFPPERVARVLGDAEAALLIAHASTASSVDLPCPALPLDHPEVRETIARAPTAVPAIDIDPDTLAHVIYTSGSTGTPKGVMIRHGGVAAFLAWMRARFPLGEGEKVLGSTSICFDVHVAEVHFTLAGGGTLVLVQNALSLAELPADAGIVQASMVPTAAQELLALGAIPSTLRRMNLGGEPVPPDLARGLAAAGVAEINNYWGPTEDTTYSTEARLAAGERVTIGRPLWGRRAYVLDAHLRPLPAGAVGEVYVAGCGVSRGYLAQPRMTAERYLPDPFGAPGARMYATGDRARWLTSGEIEYLGRADHQVKVRGFRIEPGEVEAVLRAHPAVLNAAVGVRGERADRRLVAWIVPAAGASPTPAELAAFARDRLPEYMVPGAFSLLPELPLTTTGKVDRLALPDPDFADAAEAYVAPRTPAEEVLAAIYADVLGTERVGVHDSFFALGGHSLLATRVAARVRQAFGVDLPLRALFEHPTVAGLAERVGGGAPSAERAVVPVDRTSPPPLSFAQKRLWFLDQLHPGGTVYNVPAALRLTGELDSAALERALAEIVARHEVLRTTFAAADPEPLQVIAPAGGFRLAVEEVGDEGELMLRLREESAHPFDLARGPLFRAHLFRRAADDHVLLLSMHHAVSDGWSLGVLYRELTALYDAFTRGEASPLPPLPVQYADFAVWQRGHLADGEMERQLGWWKERLAGAPELLELPTDRPRAAARRHHGAMHRAVLPREAFEAVQAVAAGADATPFMVLLAAYAVLLGRHAGQDDVVVGSPIAGRTHAELEGLIGFFVNTLPLRTDLSGDPTFLELVARVREATLGAYAHQELPFERLVDELNPERAGGWSPIFQAGFTYQNLGRAAIRLPGLEVAPVEVERPVARWDLNLVLGERTDGLAVALEYDTDLFDASTAERLVSHFARVVEQAARHPERRLSEISLVHAGEADGASTATAYPRDATIHSLFAAQAAATPDAVAVTFDGETLTYAQLDARSDALAGALAAAGVRAGDRVGLSLERSLEVPAAILAVLKAGASYVPLDSAYPADRLAGMMEDAAISVLVVRDAVPESLASFAGRVVSLAEDAIGGMAAPVDAGATAESEAYVMFTSGSTGRPKGVAVPHRAVVRLVRNTHFAEFGADQVFLQLAPLAFDASTLELWGPLLNGGRLVVHPPQTPTLEELGAILRAEGVTALWLTAGLFHQMVDEQLESLGGLRQLLAGGDVLSPAHVGRVLERFPHLRLINGYGPTENTTFTCCHDIRPEDVERGSIPIGRPVANTRVYVLDAAMRPVPVGVPGELCAAGDGLAIGYVGRPELTAERFVEVEIHGHVERVYRTGDRVRWRDDGTVEFLGRTDEQVKIRGFRIEPGEVEAALLACAGVRQATVTARLDPSGGRRLVA